MSDMPTLRPHIGKKIKRLRELKGMKQETLAAALGISHQAVSKMEQSETIEEDKLSQVALALEVTPDAIRNFNEESAVNIIASNHNGSGQSSAINFQCDFNPIEKIVELYERLLQSEREKNELLTTSFKKSAD
jgi:transcriptional regulator with XRE-family HTH domain